MLYFNSLPGVCIGLSLKIVCVNDKISTCRNVDGKRKFVGGFDLTPAKKGQRELIVYFNSDQISAITSSHQIIIN